MGRRRNVVGRESIRVSLSVPAVRMLEKLLAVGLYGSTMPELLTRLVEGELVRRLEAEKPVKEFPFE